MTRRRTVRHATDERPGAAPRHGGMLPPRAPLAMPTQDLLRRATVRKPQETRAVRWARRVIFWATGAAGVLFALPLHTALSPAGMTPVELVFLTLAAACFVPLAFATANALAGFLRLCWLERGHFFELPAATGRPRGRTALLCPVQSEEPAAIAGMIEALAGSLKDGSAARAFDVFVLSDTPAGRVAETEVRLFGALSARLRETLPVYYRRRDENVGKKAGNVRDWIEDFGGAYEFFVTLDADSVMSGETLLALVNAMEDDPDIGIIQTYPRLVEGRTLFQRLQQVDSIVHGSLIVAGASTWYGAQGNYWGHNAIVRTAAFAAAAGLPLVEARPPFGGEIRSHDFVEAALLQRAGWGVYLTPATGGSYEGGPPSLIDLAARDRRWGQGNLQHLAIVGAPIFSAMGRVHLVWGAVRYLSAALWTVTTAAGLVLALQAGALNPGGIAVDAAALRALAVVVVALLVLPKALGIAAALRQAPRPASRGARAAFLAAVLGEALFAALTAPVRVLTQTGAVLETLMGRDAGWAGQRRHDGTVSLASALRFHGLHVLAGLLVLAVAALHSGEMLAWLAPVYLGLILAAPLTWATARPTPAPLARLLARVPDLRPPAIVARSRRLAEAWVRRSAEPPAQPHCGSGG